MKSLAIFAALLAMVVAVPLYYGGGWASAQDSSRTFRETGKTVSGNFLQYWDSHGGLAQQGFPISSEMHEQSETDGKMYMVQYFERAVFEAHPEFAPPNDVLLSLLGNFLYKQKYPRGAPNQTPNTTSGSVLFRETGKRLGGVFLEYWQTHGGLPQQGFPISDEFQERSDLNGKTYRVQYFERAVFEHHPENAGTAYEVLLSQLGTFRYRAKYLQPTTTLIPATPVTRRTAAPTSTTQPPAPTATASGPMQEVRVALREWAIVPGQVEVQAGRIRFVVTNEGEGVHNFALRVEGQAMIAKTPDFERRDGPQTLEVDLARGTYVMYCSLPGHETSGQRGTLIVR